MSYIEFKNVCKEYKMGEITIKALNNTNFSIEKGELVVIVGPSGAGKTTALNILGGMDSATSGKVTVDGKIITNLKNKELIKYRRNDIGVYPRGHHPVCWYYTSFHSGHGYLNVSEAIKHSCTTSFMNWGIEWE